MAAPCALIVSCCSYQPSCLVKQIIGTEELPDHSIVVEQIIGYPWTVDNKYYTADIQLCTTTQKTIGTAEFAESVNAVVIITDDKASSFSSVKQWMPFIEQMEPEIQILACVKFDDDGEVTRDTALHWCLEKSVELVELNSEEEDEDEEEDDGFAETIGVERIVQALNACMWPNMQLKERIGFQATFMPGTVKVEDSEKGAKDETKREKQEDENYEPKGKTEQDVEQGTEVEVDSNTGHIGDTCTESATPDEASLLSEASGRSTSEKEKGRKNEAKDKDQSKSNIIDSMFGGDMELIAALGNEDPGDESFEHLFARMASMKEKANSLPPGERKKYAEQVAIAFWKAIGGDEDEINGLSDEDEAQK
ncbi:alpha- and gamma-adaptin-binding protein p34-like [Anneissia japonica]|uniref:alpha- and gamma-adaptin-binding protein p34-like n=1 Tax=Anneissia japonica TaxID=1529436 RepID=UPI00142556C8|nr:alpha- and gamma-adaptin-binding protein p34-like [Anneissia japonica]